MRFGIFGSAQARRGGPDVDSGSGFKDFVEYNIEAEGLGFHSSFLVEHHFTGFGQISATLSLLTFIAARTKTLRLGTAVIVLPWHNPVLLAEQTATLDLLSGGRVIFGIGGGWNREEMENHGTGFSTRWRLMRERVLAMKTIWAADEPEYHGDMVDFDPIWSWPKPVQRPHPPVLLGGGGERVLERVVEYGDGWMPIPGRGPLLERIPELRELCARAGRPPLPVTVCVVPPEDIGRYQEAGVERCLLAIPSLPRDEALRELDRLAPLVAQHA